MKNKNALEQGNRIRCRREIVKGKNENMKENRERDGGRKINEGSERTGGKKLE